MLEFREHVRDSHHISPNRMLSREIHSMISAAFQLSKPKTIYLEEFYDVVNGNDDGRKKFVVAVRGERGNKVKEKQIELKLVAVVSLSWALKTQVALNGNDSITLKAATVSLHSLASSLIQHARKRPIQLLFSITSPISCCDSCCFIRWIPDAAGNVERK